MHRAIVEACFPLFLCLLAGFAALWGVARLSGARFAPARLRALHRCEQGGVQTLSFVITLPVFMMLVLFIVQISQLMIGITVVHYSAFAAARAASVWFGAETPTEAANQMDPVAFDETAKYPQWICNDLTFNSLPPGRAWKYNKIWWAATMACVPISPSHQYLTQSELQSRYNSKVQTTTRLYQNLVPASSGNSAISTRLLNKFAYSAEHTRIYITGIDLNGFGPASYNPRNHPDPNVVWKQNEIGWQDPITVTVTYRFPLLTGPGRFLSPGHFLSAKLAPADGTPDKVSSRIQIWRKQDHPGYQESVYWTQLTATATVVNDGVKSMIPYVHPTESMK